MYSSNDPKDPVFNFHTVPTTDSTKMFISDQGYMEDFGYYFKIRMIKPDLWLVTFFVAAARS